MENLRFYFSLFLGTKPYCASILFNLKFTELSALACVEKMSRGNFSVSKAWRGKSRLVDFCTFRFISICCSGVVIIFFIKRAIKVSFVVTVLNCNKLNIQLHLVLLKFLYVKESFFKLAVEMSFEF